MQGAPPSLARAEARAFDRHAIEGLGLPGAVLMENAGRSAAEEALRLIAERGSRPGRAAVLCGGGNNGGDGWVVLRHLALAGVRATAWTTVDPERLKGDAALHYRVARALELPIERLESAADSERARAQWNQCDVIVDALLGTGFEGEVRPPLDAVIAAANSARAAARLAVDLPSGLDCDSGQPARATFRADVTVTFVARKRGFDAPEAAPWIGRVVVASIGVPYPARAEAAAGERA
jgi:NAD(P)H-hydrate epimerase